MQANSLITIHRNTKYSVISDKYKQHVNSLITGNKVLVPLHENFVKVNTPLFGINYIASKLLIEPFISETFHEEYQKAIAFIGYCHTIIPKRNAPNAPRDAFHINSFNDNIITYKPDEFGHIQNYQRIDFKHLFGNCFGPSSLRLMCVKAEVMIFLYFRLLTTEEYGNKDKDYDFIVGGITRAAQKYNSTEDEYLSKALYIWELTTLFNVYTSIDISEENDLSLPSHHVFFTPHRFSYIYDFGSYDITQLYTGNPDPRGGHLTLTPKSVTEMPISETFFYIPVSSIAVNESTRSFNEIVAHMGGDVNIIMKELVYIASYEGQFLDYGVVNDNSKDFSFDNLEQASEFAHHVTIPADVNTEKVYVSTLVNNNGIYELNYIKFVSGN